MDSNVPARGHNTYTATSMTGGWQNRALQQQLKNYEKSG